MTTNAPARAGSTLDQAALRPRIREVLPNAVRIRRDLHAHPELAYQEHRTSGVVCAELQRLGIAHVPGLAGGTGVLAYLPATAAGDDRPSVALRADMDALPIEERTGAAYASTTAGVMHACGHDGHTANLLGVAAVLSKVAHRPNPVHLIFQPAEEGGAGGKRMCEEGCLDGSKIGPRVGRIFGLHGWPQYELGVVGSRVGPLLAAVDNFWVRMNGEQAHAAYPQLGCDPVVASAAVIQALQTICSRNVAPTDSVVVSVTQIRAGTATNIIPARVEFGGTVRTLRDETRAMAKRRLYAIVESTAAAYGCAAEIDWREGYPVTHNEPATTERFFRVARAAVGEARVATVPTPTLGGEDFSYYGHHVPACFFILGVKPAHAAKWPSLHQPEYDFNDDALETGIELMVRLALDAE
ncbi:MAG: amidohydrolase [Phycisphaeraceae bacterium]|nr:amidohydrolase [Phycisphaeraceae bacterium]